ncbi:MAG: hypothetical protein M9884_06965 [Rhodocyclaceae bacterium]|nr:hypothetical protein [Rhodocyclaceae bacterium]
MDLELRLAALSKLMDNKSEAVERRLGEEFRRIESVLAHGIDYDQLLGALKILTVLAPRFHGAILPMLANFVTSIRARNLTHDGEPIPKSRLRYRSVGHLIREAIDVVSPVRFLYIEQAVDFLLALSRAEEEEVRKHAALTLENLANFDLDIFFGGPRPRCTIQARIVGHLGQLDNQQLVTNANVILRVLRKALSPVLKAIPGLIRPLPSIAAQSRAAGIAQMRADTLVLLKRMYPLDEEIGYRRNVLNTLDEATRRERPTVDSDTGRCSNAIPNSPRLSSESCHDRSLTTCSDD